MTIAYREDGAELDKIYITNTGTVPTDMGGDADTCTITPPPPPIGLDPSENTGNKLNIYPNPVNDNAVIEFTLENTEFVNLSIVDYTGRTVVTLVNSTLSSGMNRIAVEGSILENGIYLCRLNTDNYSAVKPLMIFR